jgi:hypothetical protein
MPESVAICFSSCITCVKRITKSIQSYYDHHFCHLQPSNDYTQPLMPDDYRDYGILGSCANTRIEA